MTPDTLLLWGVVSGLLAALAQSCSYIASRYFLGNAGSPRQLLAASLILLGVMAVAVGLWLWPDYYPQYARGRVWSSTALCSGAFLVAQAAFFPAQRSIESSRIASLLGLKVGLVALLSTWFLGTHILPWQWLAVAGTVAAAVAMNWSSGRLVWTGMGFLCVTLVGYAFSDIGVELLCRSFDTASTLESSLLAFATAYTLLALAALPLAWLFRVRMRHFLFAAPYALCWGLAMIFLYLCFTCVGAAFGNVIQATRGILSLALGIGLGFLGIPGLEGRHSAGVWLRRAAAALLMFLAVALYALSPSWSGEAAAEAAIPESTLE